jgi:hypothetical protein
MKKSLKKEAKNARPYVKKHSIKGKTYLEMRCHYIGGPECQVFYKELV